MTSSESPSTPTPVTATPLTLGVSGSLPLGLQPRSQQRSVRYRTLQADRIIQTAEQLALRIGERFPEAGLRVVADELQVVAEEALRTCERIRRPQYLMRMAAVVLLTSLIGILITIGMQVRWLTSQELFELEHFVTTLEAGLGATFFLGAIVVYLTTLERRMKRERLLVAMRELRALAHIVDMHQLTKDPESVHHHAPTKSSPRRSLTTFLLGRYLDYCSELLSLISKIGALYVQEFPDPVALDAADQLSTLTNGLSRSIWQKIMILDRATEDPQPSKPPTS